MTDKEFRPGTPVVPQPADDRFTRVERIVRWVFWIGLSAVILWFFVDLLVKH